MAMNCSKLRVLIAVVALLILPGEAPASEFSGSVVSVLDGDTIEVLRSNRAERIRLNGIDWVKPLGRRPSKLRRPWSSGRKSGCKPSERTSTGGRSPMCFYRMEPTSITSWSKTAGAGGIGSTRLGM